MTNKSPYRLDDNRVIYRRLTHNGAHERHVIGRLDSVGAFQAETPANWGGKSAEKLTEIQARAAEWITKRTK